MIEKEKLPEQTYKELIDLFGNEEADRIIVESQYNFPRISIIIFEEKVVRYFSLTEVQQWIKKWIHLTLIQFIATLILIGILINIFWPVLAY